MTFRKTIRITAFSLLLLCAVLVFSLMPAGEHIVYAQSSITEKIVDATFGGLFLWLTEVIFKISGTLLAFTGWLLDTSVQYSLDTSNFAKNAVEGGWGVLRDIANITFIFILLYIAIGTILRLGTINTKQALVNVIIIAFLINFSLFFTQVVIDASNILATFFYNNTTSITVNEQDAGIGKIMTAALQPESLLDVNGYKNLSNMKTGVAFLFGAIAVLLAAFSFLAAAIMFIMRTAVLILLMVLSPLAFAAYVLDDFREYFTKWWKTLLNQSFFAPVYLLMIYIVLLIILSPQFAAVSGNRNLAAGIDELTAGFEEPGGRTVENYFGDFNPGNIKFDPLIKNLLPGASADNAQTLAQVGILSPNAAQTSGLGELSFLSVFFSYFIILFLINGALVVAKQMGGATAAFGVKWADKIKGGLQGGLLRGATRMRQGAAVLGAGMLARSDALKKAATKTGIMGAAAREVLYGAGKRYEPTEKARIKKRVEVAKFIGRGEGGEQRLGAYQENLERGGVLTTGELGVIGKMANMRGVEEEALKEIRKTQNKKKVPGLQTEMREAENEIKELENKLKMELPIPEEESKIKTRIQELQKIAAHTQSRLYEIQAGEDLAEQIVQKLKEGGVSGQEDTSKGR